MSHELQQLIGIALVIFATLAGIGACSEGFGKGLGAKQSCHQGEKNESRR